MAEAYYATCVPTQPLDKMSLQTCYLYCFPGYLQFVLPFVNVFQAMDYKQEDTIKVFDNYFVTFLTFLNHCCAAFLSDDKPNQDMKQTTKLHNIVLTFSFTVDTKEFTFSIEGNHVKFTINDSIFPAFIAALNRILFKTFGYSHNINFLVSQYLKLAPLDLIQSPNYTNCQNIFAQLEATYIDFFLLFDIVERHSKVLYYLKLFETLKE